MHDACLCSCSCAWSRRFIKSRCVENRRTINIKIMRSRVLRGGRGVGGQRDVDDVVALVPWIRYAACTKHSTIKYAYKRLTAVSNLDRDE